MPAILHNVQRTVNRAVAPSALHPLSIRGEDGRMNLAKIRHDVTTNTVEGYFSIFKRGMKGAYQHASKKHLHRYAAEFAFRYSNRAANGVNDLGRADIALAGVAGKRLLYRDSFAV